MIYFFVKGSQFVQCEIYPGTPVNRLTVIGTDGATTSDKECSTADLVTEWSELQRGFNRSGWSGPFGRDGRE